MPVDEQIMNTIEPLLRELQQKAIQQAIDKPQTSAGYRRCPTCKKMRNKGRKSFEFYYPPGNVPLAGTYCRCGC